MINFKQTQLLTFLCFLLILLPSTARGECTCEPEDEDRNKPLALKYKMAAIASILVAGAIGVCFPLLGKTINALRPEKNLFFTIKAFAAGVILSTGFIHVLPDATESLTSPCLDENPWGKFPFAGLVAMTSAIATLMVDVFATSHYTKSHFNKTQHINGDEEKTGEHENHVHVHTHATHGHAHGSVSLVDRSGSSELLRHRVVSQSRAVAIMALFFSLTTPVGIAIGIGISNIYDESSPTALIVEGIFNAASAGILIYMALAQLECGAVAVMALFFCLTTPCQLELLSE
ncbi:Zinc/iron permease - like 2 [Theobroma cacao]|nr:Zinc/iron permease - like 2 [Theobroma cacao]